MIEVVSPSSFQRAQSPITPARQSRMNSLEALERGFALFRSTFVLEAWRYYAGRAPLVFLFVRRWGGNARIRVPDGVVLLEAAMLAAAYLLRLWMVAGYMQRIRERAFRTPASKPVGAIAQTAALGRLLAWKITLSAGALIALVTF